MTVLAGTLATACGKVGTGPSFGTKSSISDGSSSAALISEGTSWSGPFTIDVGSGNGIAHLPFIAATNYTVNNDMSPSCTAPFTIPSGGVPVRGCMQNPAVTFSDNRFMVGFTQNYIPQDTNTRTTLFNAMTSLNLNRSFLSVFGGILGILDTARGLFPFPNPVATGIDTSSRYVRYANFPNGNVIAVYFVELPITAGAGDPLDLVNPTLYNYTRTVHATIYTAASHTWSLPVQLGTATINPPAAPPAPNTGSGNQTDMGVDYVSPTAVFPLQGGNFASFCRPSVATSGDNSAMVAWCEQPRAVGIGAPEQVSQVMYARYVSGVWQPLGGTGVLAAPLIGTPAATTNYVANPWFNAKRNLLANAPALSDNTVNAGDIFAPGIIPIDNPSFTVSGTPLAAYNNQSFVKILAAPVTAVAAFPAVGQFAIKTDGNGGVLVCATLQNMINTALSQVAVEYWDFSNSLPGPVNLGLRKPSELGFTAAAYPPVLNPGNKTLSQLGLSMRLDPGCNDTATLTSIPSAQSFWNITSYFNRSLNNVFHNIDFTTPITKNQQNVVTNLFYFGINSGVLTPKPTLIPTPADPLGNFPAGQPAGFPALAAPKQESWVRSAMVDVAGDGSGNYALVRSSVQPFFQDNNFTSTGISRARGLVGHQFSGNLNAWIQRPNANVVPSNTGGEPAMSFISSGVSCGTGTPGAGAYIPCSVRNPRFLMSDSGKGLVLFYQNQTLATNATATASVANPNRLWAATYSTGSGFGSVAAPLDLDTTCTGSSVTSNDASVCEAQSYEIPVVGGFPSRCQVVGEPSNALQPPLFASITHDPQTIPAAMNRAGQALVAYAKSIQTGGPGAPACGNVGIFVVSYDTFNGFGSTVHMDDGLGDSMHPAVYVTPKGDMAVVWEQVVGTVAPLKKFVYLRVFTNGAWSSQIQMNWGQLDSAEAMMPGVGIDDSGEIVVTYTYGPGDPGPTRRQYVNHYYYH